MVPQEVVALNFMPPVIFTALKNEKGQRIIEVCLWLQSGLELDDISVYIGDDMKTLKYEMRMDPLMQNGAGLHQDLVPHQGPKAPCRKDCLHHHFRVHHWNSMIDAMRTGNGLLPRFTAEIALPEQVCSKRFLRQVGKASPRGSKMLQLDLLVEDSKHPRSKKRSFELITDDVL